MINRLMINQLMINRLMINRLMINQLMINRVSSYHITLFFCHIRFLANLTYTLESLIRLHLFLSHPFLSRCDLYFECLLLSNYTYFCHICFLADLPSPLPQTRILINTETSLTYLGIARFFG